MFIIEDERHNKIFANKTMKIDKSHNKIDRKMIQNDEKYKKIDRVMIRIDC